MVSCCAIGAASDIREDVLVRKRFSASVLFISILGFSHPMLAQIRAGDGSGFGFF